MAFDLARAESQLGLKTVVCDTLKKETWAKGIRADVHVVHSHIPDEIAFDRSAKIVCFEHGSPDHVFEISVVQGVHDGYGAGDSFGIASFFLKRADVILTFWERERRIWQTMTDKKVICVPMGIDTEFWTRQTVDPLIGEPSFLTAENCHSCKWPLDLFFIWPEIVKKYPGARLHALNIPQDQQRWWTALAFLNGTNYTSYMKSIRLDHPALRNFLSACSFYYSPVKTGDHNRICLEAASCGAKIISYEGNEYAHYWVREGNQWRQLEDILCILSGKKKPREVSAVPDIKETAKATAALYRDLLA